MEPCSCAHEQQVRHLKSRVSQLEIMLDKAHKRITTLTQTPAVAASPPASPQMMMPRTVSATDVRRSEEYRRLQNDLENEKRIKMDLMANLKELTTSNEAAQARMAQEMDELKAQYETTMNGMDEIQEEFDRMRIAYDADGRGSIEQSRTEHDAQTSNQTAQVEKSSEGADEPRISASMVRSLAMHIDRRQEQRTRQSLEDMIRRCPQEVQTKSSSQASDGAEERLGFCIARLTDGYVDEADLQALQSIISACDTKSNSSTEHKVIKPLVQSASSAVTRRLETLESNRDILLQTLYRTVPATFEELSSLFTKTSSFSYPDRPTSKDDLSIDVFDSYLKTTTSNLSHTIRKYISSHSKSRQKISYRGFAAGDLALFLPTRNANSPAWAAFNVGAPHYFLAMEGVETEGKDFLIGRIQEIAEKSGEPGVESPSSVGSVVEVRKWWEVKILEKKKVSAI